MHIIAIAWIYVVLLMSLTEPNVVAGIMTFLGYCVLPLTIILYITGSPKRRQRRKNAAAIMPEPADHKSKNDAENDSTISTAATQIDLKTEQQSDDK